MSSFAERMKIDDIEAFAAVVRAQSLSQAALTLGITQPAVTRRVQSLEAAFGVELLDRQTKPPKPNAMGLRVYEHCRAVLREMLLLHELAATREHPGGDLRLGLTQALGDRVLPALLDDLAERFPQLQPRLATAWGGELVERIDHGELDAAVALMPRSQHFPRNVVATALGHTRLCVVAQRGSFGRRRVKLADCSAHGWVLNPDGCGFRAGLQRALEAQGLALRVILDTFGREMQMKMVAQGVGLGLMPEALLTSSAHRDELEVLSLADFKPELALWGAHGSALGALHLPVEAFFADVTRAIGLATPRRRGG